MVLKYKVIVVLLLQLVDIMYIDDAWTLTHDIPLRRFGSSMKGFMWHLLLPLLIIYYVRTKYEVRSNDLNGSNIFHYCTRSIFSTYTGRHVYFLTWQHVRHFDGFGHSFYHTNFVCNRTG